MSYRGEMLKQLANGKYANKNYVDYMKKNNNIEKVRGQKNNSESQQTVSPRVVAHQKHHKRTTPNAPSTERNRKKISTVDTNMKKSIPTEINKNIAALRLRNNYTNQENIVTDDTPQNNIYSDMIEETKNHDIIESEIVSSQEKNDAVMAIKIDEVKPQAEIIHVDKSVISKDEIHLQTMEKKLNDLENHLIDIAIELDILSNNQKKIMGMLNKMYIEINRPRNHTYRIKN